RQDVSGLGVSAEAHRALAEGLYPYRKPGRRDRSTRAAEQASHRRVLPLEVQGRRGRVRPHRRVPGRMEELADRSASELARLVRSREISPVEVVEDCLARVERYNPAVNAPVTLNPRALAEADELQRPLAPGGALRLL